MSGTDYLKQMEQLEKFGVEEAKKPLKIMIDYGGPNVAKPLHVGHLRSAIIGESVKRIARFMGHDVIGDIHLGDWGLQMGLIITELYERNPSLVYFDDTYTGEYPEEAPFTISELEEIYPAASKRSKEDEEYKQVHEREADSDKPDGNSDDEDCCEHGVADRKGRLFCRTFQTCRRQQCRRTFFIQGRCYALQQCPAEKKT